MHIVGIDQWQNLIGRYLSERTLHQPHLRARILGDTAAFVKVHVGTRLADHFIARLGMHLNGNLVCHGAGRTKQSRFHPEKIGHTAFQSIYGNVFPEHIIPHLGRKHGLQHGFRRLGKGIGTKFYGCGILTHDGVKLQN